jgi:hypothetical protein
MFLYSAGGTSKPYKTHFSFSVKRIMHQLFLGQLYYVVPYREGAVN